jgi:hypothetical protein
MMICGFVIHYKTDVINLVREKVGVYYMDKICAYFILENIKPKVCHVSDGRLYIAMGSTIRAVKAKFTPVNSFNLLYYFAQFDQIYRKCKIGF